MWMIPGETVQSPLPQDLPWWMPDHAIFFGVLYIVLAVIGIGMGIVVMKSVWESKMQGDESHGHH